MYKFMELLIGFIVQCVVGISGAMVFPEFAGAFFSEHANLVNNPDRGIYIQIATENADTMYRYKQQDQTADMRLILLTLELKNYRNKEYLDEKKLEELEYALRVAGETNFSVIFRASYGFDGRNFEDAKELSYILNHVAQICGVLNRHTDIVLCVQAGMIGPYGEWHTSKYLEGGYNAQAHQVLARWLELLPKEVCVALRRPCFVRSAIGMGADGDRLTVHNDALLSTDSDMGTFSDASYGRQDELLYTGSLTAVYMGGEMPRVSDYTAPETAVSEFDAMGINYLNKYYNEDVWRDWAKKAYHGWAFDTYVRAHLGYRLVLRRMTEIKHGDETDLIFRMENVGFGKPDARVVFYLYFNDGEKEQLLPLCDTDESEDGYRFFVTVPSAGDQMGIVMTRFPVSDTPAEYFIELANKETEFKNGINYIPFSSPALGQVN